MIKIANCNFQSFNSRYNSEYWFYIWRILKLIKTCSFPFSEALTDVDILFKFINVPLKQRSIINFLCPSFHIVTYPVSRGPSIFLDKSGRGGDLCQPPRLSLICRSSTETDESVRFETSFSRFCSARMCLVRNC